MAPAARTFHGLVRAAAQAHGSAPALVEGDRRLTWAELSAQVDRTAAGWAGLGPGSTSDAALRRDRRKSRNGPVSVGCAISRYLSAS